jgi:SSS family solute:Na+ symporter
MPNFQSQIHVADFLSVADFLIFAFIMVLSAVVVAWGNRLKKNVTEETSLLEYLVMGRTLTLPLFTATLVASWYGGIFGVTEIAFQSGVYNFLTQGVFWYVTYLIFAFFLVDKVRGSQAMTLPELVGKNFGPYSARVAGVFNFFNILPVAYVMSVGLFLQILFGGQLLWCTVIGAGFVTLYSMWGGLRAVVFSDIVQFVVMCASVALVAGVSVAHFGGMDFLHAHLPATHFDATGGHSWSETLVWGFIALGTLVDPNFYQKCFAANKPRTAKIGILISTLIWCVFDLCTTLGGMYARAVVPEAQSNHAYLIYALQLLPPGWRGFFLAGVLSTVLSTLDAFFFIASNTLSYDLGPKRFKNKIAYGHFCTVLVCAFAVGLSLFFSGSVKSAWKTLGSYSAGCLLIPMMIGFWRPGFISDRVFVLGTLSGAVGITYWRLTEHAGFWANVDDLYAGLAFTFAGLCVGKIFFDRILKPVSAKGNL